MNATRRLGDLIEVAPPFVPGAGRPVPPIPAPQPQRRRRLPRRLRNRLVEFGLVIAWLGRR